MTSSLDVTWTCFPWMVQSPARIWFPLCSAAQGPVSFWTGPGMVLQTKHRALPWTLGKTCPLALFMDPTLTETSPRTAPSLGCPTSPLGKRSGNKDRENLISPKCYAPPPPPPRAVPGWTMGSMGSPGGSRAQCQVCEPGRRTLTRQEAQVIPLESQFPRQ